MNMLLETVAEEVVVESYLLPSPLVGEGGEALRAGWGVKPQQLAVRPVW